MGRREYRRVVIQMYIKIMVVRSLNILCHCTIYCTYVYVAKHPFRI